MKKKTKIILLVLLVIFVLSLFTNLNISLHKSSYSVTTYSISNTERFDSIKNGEFLEKADPYIIVFHGLRDNNTEDLDNSKNILKVYVNKQTSVGLLRFIPIVKPITFSSSISYRWFTQVNRLTKQTSISDSGSFEIRGKYNLYGFYSVKTAEQLVLDVIDEQVKKKIKDDLFKRLNNKNELKLIL